MGACHGSLLTLLMVVLVQSGPQLAQACSPLFGYARDKVTPADGAVGVPTNAQVRLGYGGAAFLGFSAYEDVVIQPAGGGPIAATVVTTGIPASWTVTLRPAAALLPLTTYQVLAAVKAPCGPYDTDCKPAQRELVATFTTGAAPDVTPPAFAGIANVTTQPEVCESDGCCGPFRAIHFTFEWGDATDDTGVVGYRIYKDDALVADTGARHGVFVCSGEDTFTPGYLFFAGAGSYRARAFDIAGNEDANRVAVDVRLDCSSESGTPGGCAGARPPSGGGLALLSLALMLGAMLTRRARG
ncbi:MAG TPA: Ig-like domain-containing protein [Polyangia bacterium]|jgi:hypothetical protein